MRAHHHRLLIVSTGAVIATGCVNARAPDIYINDAPRQRVDSSSTPHPATLEESHAELDRAYARIRDLENDLSKTRKDRDEYKDKYKKLKDKYED